MVDLNEVRSSDRTDKGRRLFHCSIAPLSHYIDIVLIFTYIVILREYWALSES